MPTKPINLGPILETLRLLGPSTTAEIADYLEWDFLLVSKTIGNVRQSRPGQVIRIARHRPVIGARRKDTNVYEAAAGPDSSHSIDGEFKAARKTAASRRYREKNQTRLSAARRHKRAVAKGTSVSLNPWAALAPPSLRTTMAKTMKPPKETEA